MGDLILNYRACGAECREDWLRMLTHDNGLPLFAVQQLADELGERKDFGKLVRLCECGGSIVS
jgi:hypothetical protein